MSKELFVAKVPIGLLGDFESLDPNQTGSIDIHIQLYRKVSNVEVILERIVEINKDNELVANGFTVGTSNERISKFKRCYLAIKPEMVVSTDHVTHSVCRAIANVLNDKTVTGNLSTEILYFLGGSTSVTSCIEQMSIPKGQNSLPLLLVGIISNLAQDDVSNLIDGELDDLENLPKYTDVDAIIKVSV
ncbi:hypothetical protein BEWA_031820 [Theileria equi strain WA]|uniref:Uncharacterized protein n=1 Tax=Theileria equi strain WA TaxID=1537102 RepID=L0AZK8_THEEQ|nr:hypothetical protein BEWA_031820 [Theileria equi strain WA]AFZ80329.1 hypothetical protein BEWA_031820 [Theileria equi strain WA]|eukprot:XP_004829995.1 hypothetical protein BEWA_031820 [Theileria equi strain WA]